MQLDVTPCPPPSSAVTLLNPSRPCLAATYALLNGEARIPCTEDRLMIRPKPLLYMCGRAARISRNGASSIRVMIRRNCTGSNSSMGLMRWIPALFTRMSQSRLRVASESTSIRSTAQEVPPTSSASAAAPAESTSATTTFAPRAASSLTHAAPIPLAPPVTRALRPFKVCSIAVPLCSSNRLSSRSSSSAGPGGQQAFAGGVGLVHFLQGDALGLPQAQHGCCGDGARHHQVNRSGQPRPRVLQPLGGQQRRERAGEDGGHLRAERYARVAHAGGEQFGHDGRLSGVHKRVEAQSNGHGCHDDHR